MDGWMEGGRDGWMMEMGKEGEREGRMDRWMVTNDEDVDDTI